MKKIVVLLIAALGLWQGARWVYGSRWDGQHRITVAVAGEKLMVVSYERRTQTAVVARVPDTLLMEATHGYGEYPARSLWGLDVQEKLEGELIRDGTSHLFAAMPLGYLAAEGQTEAVAAVGNAGWKKLWGKRTSDLSIWDLGRLWWGLRGLRTDQIEVIDLEETDAVNAADVPDGSRAYRADLQRLSAYSMRWFRDEALVNDPARVLVVNTTGAAGLGALAGRVVETAGMHVVGVEDSGDKLGQTQVLVAEGKLKQRYLVQALGQFFRAKPKVEKTIGARSEIVVKLGEDYRRRLQGDK